jgi:hypothetical protein
MPAPLDEHDLAQLEAAYRRAWFTIVGHSIFLFVCCAAAILLRRMFGMPPALLSMVFIVALVLFGADFVRFVNLRRKVLQAREHLS